MPVVPVNFTWKLPLLQYGENILSKKKLQLHENYESYPSILQCALRVLAHTLMLLLPVTLLIKTFLFLFFRLPTFEIKFSISFLHGHSVILQRWWPSLERIAASRKIFHAQARLCTQTGNPIHKTCHDMDPTCISLRIKARVCKVC